MNLTFFNYNLIRFKTKNLALFLPSREVIIQTKIILGIFLIDLSPLTNIWKNSDSFYYFLMNLLHWISDRNNE